MKNALITKWKLMSRNERLERSTIVAKVMRFFREDG